MKAPEKIYVHKSQYWGLMANEDNITKKGIEYTRTDAFIEKAENFLYEKLNSGEMECGDIVVFIEKFRNYMKGE